MQIIKPRTLSLVSNTYHFHRHTLAIGVVGFFSLKNPRTFISEAQGWSQLTPALSSGLILDMGYAKPCGEMLLAGNAYAPDADAVTRMNVSASLGKLKKTLQIIGDRRWNGRFLRKASAPRPFHSMSLDFSRTYGGSGFSENPAGKGVISEENRPRDGFFELPNIYHCDEKTAADSAPRTPVSFGPLDVMQPQRSRFHGTFDQSWLDNIHPGFPLDTNPLFFNAASEDQHIKGFFSPGEAFEIQGMHPESAIIQGHLPQLRARAFVSQIVDGETESHEVATAIDTVWFFPDLDIGVVIYRGTLHVQNSLGLDVTQLLLAYEHSDDPARTVAYYQQVLKQKTDPETAAGHILNESQLLPQKSAAEEEEVRQLYAEAKAQVQEKKQNWLKHILADKPLSETEKNKIREQVLADDPKEPAPIPKALVDRGDIDLSPYIDEAKALAEKARQDAKQQQMQASQYKKNLAPESESEMRQRVFSPFKPQPADQLMAATPPASQRSTSEQLQLAENLQKNSQRQARQQAPECTALSKPLPASGARMIRDWVVDLLNAGESLAGRDLAGGDLAGLDFSGQDMTAVMLERADLSGCCFDHCILDGSVLTEADISYASFCNARMQRANLSGTRGHDAVFTGADLSHALLVAAKLHSCNFSGATLNRLIAAEATLNSCLFQQTHCREGQFIQAQLPASDWQDATVSATNFTQAELQHSNWQRAQLNRCLMIDIKADHINFSGCQAEKIQFSSKGELNHAIFTASSWHICGFSKLNMQQSCIRDAVFRDCDLSETKLNHSDLRHSLLHNCLLRHADLSHCDCQKSFFSSCTLVGTDFTAADLSEVQLRHCNTKEAIFHDSRRQHMDQRPDPSLI